MGYLKFKMSGPDRFFFHMYACHFLVKVNDCRNAGGIYRGVTPEAAFMRGIACLNSRL